MEPQTRASRVLRAAAQPTAKDDTTRAPADSATAYGPADLESHLGARFHDRNAVRQPPHPTPDRSRGNRERLEIAVGPSLPSRRVTRYSTNSWRFMDDRPPCGSTTEFTAQAFVDWCTEHGIAVHYIQPGKPDQNAYIERFNRSSDRSPERASLRIDRRAARPDGPLARDLQPGAAPRQPRPGAIRGHQARMVQSLSTAVQVVRFWS